MDGVARKRSARTTCPLALAALAAVAGAAHRAAFVVEHTSEVAGRYGPQVRYIAKHNGGQTSALNVRLREAAGDIVCLLDGDNYFYPWKVRLVVDAFRRHPEAGLVYDEFDIIDSVGTSLQKPYKDAKSGQTGARYQLRSPSLFERGPPCDDSIPIAPPTSASWERSRPIVFAGYRTESP
jgi:glycosyltransferase involved in cell wall biosynthesis